MSSEVYRFEFADAAKCQEAELTLHLATYAIEGLFGAAAVRLETGYHVDEPQHALVIDGQTDLGAALVRVFTSLALHEFGPEGFHVRRAKRRDLTTGRAA
jgi:hypothetical protein